MPASCLHAEENENSWLYDKQALTAGGGVAFLDVQIRTWMCIKEHPK